MPLFQAGTVPGPSTTSSVPLFSLSIRPISTLWTPSRTRSSRLPRPFAASGKPDPKPEPGAKPKARRRRLNPEPPREGDETVFPKWRPRRGRRTETEAVEDFVRNRLEQTFKTIREQNPGLWEEKGNNVMKEVKKEEDEDEEDEERTGVMEEDEDEDEEDEERTGVMEEDSEAWPVDAEVGWGIRASEYFEKHAIKNVVGEDGLEIDWEGELDDTWVQEINCLEWERFAFHPSPLVVLAFERYNNASENWKTLKELEKAAKVYWSTKDRLPPRTVKLDINIEKDLAYALKVRECPQILFLKGQRMLYREKGFRTADELVQMIAHFYYNAKKPSCMKDAD